MANSGACTTVEECNANAQYLGSCCPQVLQGTAVNCEVGPGKPCPDLSYQLPARVRGQESAATCCCREMAVSASRTPVANRCV